MQGRIVYVCVFEYVSVHVLDKAEVRENDTISIYVTHMTLKILISNDYYLSFNRLSVGLREGGRERKSNRRGVSR